MKNSRKTISKNKKVIEQKKQQNKLNYHNTVGRKTGCKECSAVVVLVGSY